MSKPIFLLLYLLIICPSLTTSEFQLTILHNSDLSGSYEEISPLGRACKHKKECVAGFPRIAHVIQEQNKAAKNVVYFSTGDFLTGTIWAKLFNWTIAAEMFNALGVKAVSLGKNDLVYGIEGLVEFIKLAKFPVVCSNIDIEKEYLKEATLHKHFILDVAGTKIGIVGYISQDALADNPTDHMKIIDEIDALNKECKILIEEGVKIILALGHSGIEKDVIIAKNVVKLVDIILGGGTTMYSLFWNGPQPDTESVSGVYPYMVEQAPGKRVPISHVHAYGKYLGVMNVVFNDEGNITNCTGQPILLAHDTPADPKVQKLLDKFRPAVEAAYKTALGETRVFLDGRIEICGKEECNLANMVTDAMLNHRMYRYNGTEWTDAPIAIINSGSLQGSLDKGPVTYGDLLSLLPFQHELIVMSLTGKELMAIIEQGFSDQVKSNPGAFLHFAGLRVIYNQRYRNMERVVKVMALCSQCRIPHYKRLLSLKSYRFVTTDYLASGGYNYTGMSLGSDMEKLTFTETDVTRSYVKRQQKIHPGIEGRIIVAPINRGVMGDFCSLLVGCMLCVLWFFVH